MDATKKLTVLIVGAGIAGLSTGMMLREYADVTILESASELRAVGAAVSLSPGAVKILRRFGVHLESEGGVTVSHLSVWTPAGKQIALTSFDAVDKAGEINLAVHRADLHSALLCSATSPGGPGVACKVLLDHKVVTVDSYAGIVVTQDGTEYTADVIIGADGIRSVIRPFVVPGHKGAEPTGESAYRFMLTLDDLRSINHPLLDNGKIPQQVQLVVGPHRKILAYPCRRGSVINCVAYVPDNELHEIASEKWMVKGDPSAMMDAYKTYSPVWTDFLRLAKDIGLWQMRDTDPLPNWVKDRVILIGDAAHPMLPHAAAGAMSAIEDAEALYVHLRAANPSVHASIHEALDHVFRVRYRRASQCQERSRAAGLRASQGTLNQRADDILEMWMYPGAERWEAERPEMVIPV